MLELDYFLNQIFSVRFKNTLHTYEHAYVYLRLVSYKLASGGD